MTDDIRLLETARATWLRAQPSDRDLQKATTRILLSMRKARRPARALPALAATIALLATLAYAASSRWLSPTPPSSPVHVPVPSIPPAPAPDPDPAPTTTTPTASANAPPPATPTPLLSTPHASWADVSRALASGDTRAADIALRDLAARGDPSTRAKAKLGIAQLALARGDKARAAALAHQVLSTRGIEPPLAARAREIVLQSAEP
jgi:hypothetical protein